VARDEYRKSFVEIFDVFGRKDGCELRQKYAVVLSKERLNIVGPSGSHNQPRALMIKSAIFASPSSGAPESKAALFGRAR
jgi:hypothetical protein